MQACKALFFENYLLCTTTIAYLVAQISKTILYSLINKKFEYRRLFGSGGMPSSHSASVAALAAASLMKFGPTSPTTAVTIVLAIIVIHDARGVRQEAGKHAMLLNRVMKSFDQTEIQIQLNEMVGHTLLQVLVGTLLGIVVVLCIPVF